MPVDVDFAVVLRGYDTAAVDDLVQRIHDAMESDSPAVRAAIRNELRQVAFRVRMRGYDRAQVDQYLRMTAEHLV